MSSSLPGRALDLPTNLDDILSKVSSLLTNYLKDNYKESTPVYEYVSPEQLRKILDFNLPEQGEGLEGVLNDSLVKTLKYSTRTGHIRFYNQLWAGSDHAAIIAEWFLSVLNTSMYTYEVAPVFTLMEMTLVDKFCEMVGFKDGEGTFAPGGAHANYLAMIAARQHHFPHVKKEGLKPTDKPVCFTSAHSHYTIARGSSLLGYGTENCVYVDVDSQGRMKPEALEKAIQTAIDNGRTPFFVNATAGSTVFGAFDPFEQIAAICHKFNVWMHIDACWGGHCLYSQKRRFLMTGSHLADSVALTGTKCLGIPQQCALVVIKKKGSLRTCNAMNADYLFHEYEEKNYDLGDLTLNCGRRVDSFKLWVSWKVYGHSGLEARVDHAFEQAEYCAKICKENDAFLLAHEPQSLNVCFWYVPKELRNKPRTKEGDQKLDKITSLIRRRIQLEGKVLTNFADVPGLPHFFRHITCNPGASGEDMKFVMSEIERIGDSIKFEEI